MKDVIYIPFEGENIRFENLNKKQVKCLMALLETYKPTPPKKSSEYKENWNPDWKGDPNDPLRWKGW